jgi:hypothetical protein
MSTKFNQRRAYYWDEINETLHVYQWDATTAFHDPENTYFDIVDLLLRLEGDPTKKINYRIKSIVNECDEAVGITIQNILMDRGFNVWVLRNTK